MGAGTLESISPKNVVFNEYRLVVLLSLLLLWVRGTPAGCQQVALVERESIPGSTLPWWHFLRRLGCSSRLLPIWGSSLFPWDIYCDHLSPLQPLPPLTAHYCLVTGRSRQLSYAVLCGFDLISSWFSQHTMVKQGPSTYLSPPSFCRHTS